MTTFRILFFAALAMGGLGAGAEEPPVVHFDFNGIDKGVVADTSGNRNDGRMSSAAVPCDGVDGHGVRFPNRDGYINIELDETWRRPGALTVACWVAPEEINHQVVAHAAPMKDSVDDASFALRLREGWQVWFAFTAADGERRGVSTPGPGFDRIAYPEPRNWVFLRLAADKNAFYVVNTNGAAVQAVLKTGVSGRWRDAASGEVVRCDGDATAFSLKAFECKVYRPESR